MSNRDEFSPDVKETLAKRVGMLCSRCGRATSGPHDNPSKAVNKRSGLFGRLIQRSSATNLADGPDEILPPLQGLDSFCSLTQGGARFTSLALGYYLSPRWGFSLAGIRGIRVKHPCSSAFIRGFRLRSLRRDEEINSPLNAVHPCRRGRRRPCAPDPRATRTRSSTGTRRSERISPDRNSACRSRRA